VLRASSTETGSHAAKLGASLRMDVGPLDHDIDEPNADHGDFGLGALKHPVRLRLVLDEGER
jgi:hypothetical protein